jgi:hypothetical protein
MRKEYLPAILLYVLSAALYAVAVALLLLKNYHWATFLVGGVIVMLFASSRLVKIGRRLREDDKREEDGLDVE